MTAPEKLDILAWTAVSRAQGEFPLAEYWAARRDAASRTIVVFICQISL
jgi:hypothetical protein